MCLRRLVNENASALKSKAKNITTSKRRSMGGGDQASANAVAVTKSHITVKIPIPTPQAATSGASENPVATAKATESHDRRPATAATPTTNARPVRGLLFSAAMATAIGSPAPKKATTTFNAQAVTMKGSTSVFSEKPGPAFERIQRPNVPANASGVAGTAGLTRGGRPAGMLAPASFVARYNTARETISPPTKAAIVLKYATTLRTASTRPNITRSFSAALPSNSSPSILPAEAAGVPLSP